MLLISFHSPLLVAEELTTLTGNTMGTTYSIKFLAPNAAFDSQLLQTKIDLCLQKVNRQMSTWLPDSEISRFNQSKSTQWFPVSPETALVVQTALVVSRKTDGAFDVTVGPLVNLWRFGPDKPEEELPSEEIITQTKQRVGHQFLDVRSSPPALRKSKPDLSVDLSAIAKGFGVDQVAGVLDAHSVANYLVEIGGEVRTLGVKPNGEPWKVGIEKPTPMARSVQTPIELSGRGLATSGGYRNFRVIDGKRYSHTIHPKTGKPVEHQLASVSVVAENCMLADAYATAFLVLGPDAGYDWAKSQGVAALFIVQEGDQFLEKATPAFTAFLPKEDHSTMGTTWLLTAGIFLLALLLMSVGVLLGNRSIKGSCGGLAGMKDQNGNTICNACTNPAPECQATKPGQAANEDCSSMS